MVRSGAAQPLGATAGRDTGEPVMKARTLTAGAAVVAVGVGAVVWHAAGASSRAAAPAAPAVSTSTAPVTLGDVTQRVQISGTLGYSGAYTVINQLPPGIVTAAADPGTAVVRGANLFTVSGTPVVLLYGTTPAYRDFTAGMSDGPDVRELEENLVALGMDPSHTITVDNHFSWATTAAISRWQTARGLPTAQRTGTITLGQVIFLPGALRISQAPATVGASIGPGAPVLSGTSTTHVVAAQLTTDRQNLVHVGDQVLVTLPAGATPVTGTINKIGRVASGGTNTTSGGSVAGSGPATVPVTVALQLPAGVGDLDQAPVQVAITTAQHKNVLMVPVTALLAKLGGGYHVRVIEAGGTRLLDVQPGLYDDTAGTVELTGAGLTQAMNVEVPAS
jgi:peptidoglycan hydrolase-like protein with peptidoglycan-binding domain